MKIHTLLKVATLGLFLLLGLSLNAQEVDQGQPTDIVKKQKHLLGQMKPYVEAHYTPTIYAMKRATERVLSAAQGTGLFHSQTRRAFQKFVMLADSHAYFDRIKTPEIVTHVEEFQKETQKIKNMLGLESPLGSATAATYRQIKELLEQLQQHPITENLEIMTQQRLTQLAELLSTSEGLDTMPMLQKGERIARDIRSMYGEFEQIDVLDSKTAFNIVLEIRGLNEFFMAYVIREQK